MAIVYIFSSMKATVSMACEGLRMALERFFSDSVAHRFEKCCIIGNLDKKEMMCLGKLLDNLE